MRLLADIGGTNTRLATLHDSGRIESIEVIRNEAHPDFVSALQWYIGDREAEFRRTRVALAVAAPIEGDRVTLTNRGWEFSISDLARKIDAESIQVVNDFTANAMALPFLTPENLFQVGGSERVANKPMGIIGPGTGLGVSALIPSTQGWHAISGEGGHVTLAAGNARESRIIDLVREEFGHVSAERLLSGSGLSNLYAAIARDNAHNKERVSPDRIAPLAREGDIVARETLAMFFALLGGVAGDLALTLGSLGGIYIAGGIVPRLKDEFLGSSFRQRFEDKGRFRSYNQRITTSMVTAQIPAFTGLAAMLDGRVHPV